MRDTARTDLPRSLPPEATRANTASVARRMIVLVLALGQIAAPALLFPDGFRAASPGPEAAPPPPTPLEPAGYAFIIWSAIFTGSFAYAVLQALPRAAEAPLYRAIGWRTAVGFAASIGWLVTARFGPLWATVPLILVMWGTLAPALVVARRLVRERPDAAGPFSPRVVRAVVLLPLGLYAGWLSVAIFANSAEVLRGYGFRFLGIPPVIWSVVALLVAAALALEVLARSGYSRAYAAAVIWALCGIAAANVSRGISALVAAVAVLLAIVLAAVAIGGRRGAGAPGRTFAARPLGWLRVRAPFLAIAGAALLTPRTGAAQAGVVAGRVVSAATREPLAGVQVRVTETERATTTAEDGRFVLRDVPPGVRAVEARRIGFAPVIRGDVPVSAGRAAEIEIALEPLAARLAAVTVRPTYFPPASASAPVSTQTLTAEEIRRAPGVQEDVVRAASVLPGASVTDPVANAVVVRGGAPGENLYVVDGVEVSTLNHFGAPGTSAGVLSIFPVALVSDVSFSAGGFGVRYGDRTSSATTVTLREGSREATAGQLTFSATGVGAIVEGPLGARTTAIVGARRSYFDLLFGALGFPFVPAYTDVTAKVVTRPGARDRVSAFVSGAVDRVRVDPSSADDRYDLSRLAIPAQDGVFGGVGWQHILSRGVVTTTVGRSWNRFFIAQRDSGAAGRAPAVVFRTDAEEGETTARGDLSLEVAPAFSMDAGAEVGRADRLRYRVLLPGEFRTDNAGAPRPLDADTAFGAWRVAGYAQLALRASPRLRVTGGLRADRYGAFAGGARLAPRGVVSWSVDDASVVSLAGGRYWQPPAYAWLVGDPANPRALRPFRADQLVLAVQRALRPDVRLQIETYVKAYADYPARVFRPRAVLQLTGTDVTTDVPLGLEPLASVGRGRAWGVEGFVQKRLSEVPVYALLAVSVNRTRFRALDGVTSLGAFDLPLAVSGQAGWRPSAAWELAARLRTGSGLPTTPFVESGPAAGTLDYVRYDAGPRLAPFFALDVRADRRWTLGARGQLTTYLDVQDATTRRNETFPVFDERSRRVKRQFLSGFLPSIGITWERQL